MSLTVSSAIKLVTPTSPLHTHTLCCLTPLPPKKKKFLQHWQLCHWRLDQIELGRRAKSCLCQAHWRLQFNVLLEPSGPSVYLSKRGSFEAMRGLFSKIILYSAVHCPYARKISLWPENWFCNQPVACYSVLPRSKILFSIKLGTVRVMHARKSQLTCHLLHFIGERLNKLSSLIINHIRRSVNARKQEATEVSIARHVYINAQ